MSVYFVNIPGREPDYFSFPRNQYEPLRSIEALEGAQNIEVVDTPEDSVQKRFYSLYSAEKRAYEKIWRKCGGKPSENLLTIRHEFCAWLENREIKVLDCADVQLGGIDLGFLSSVENLEVLILNNCQLNNGSVDQLEKLLRDKQITLIDLSNNKFISRTPKLKRVKTCITKGCPVYEPQEWIYLGEDSSSDESSS